MRSLALVLALTAAVTVGGCTGGASPPGPAGTAGSTVEGPTAPPAPPTGEPEVEAAPASSGEPDVEAAPPPTGGPEMEAAPAHTGGPATTARPTPAPCPVTGAVDAASWTQADGGRSLAVSPAQELRDCAGPLVRWDGRPPGWAEVVDLAGPEADTAAMEQQYVCHLRFARAKETWNLEPWRPEVTEEELIRARCNP